MPDRRHVHPLGIPRIDDDVGDLLRIESPSACQCSPASVERYIPVP
jgi:hypothetical protein